MKNFMVDVTKGDRGSMVLLTERRRTLGPQACERCGGLHDGGAVHAAIVQERDESDTQWLLWVLADGFSVSDESANGPIPICSDCQIVPVIRTLLFAHGLLTQALFAGP
jgi:hypothetical protein